MPKRSAILAAVAIAGIVVCAHAVKARGADHEQNSAAAVERAADCDRQCLYGFVDQYLQALVAKDPSRLPWAKSVKFTENNVVLAVGDGLWGTISGLGPEDVRAADPANGQVLYMGVVAEHGIQSFLALRLKVDDRKISEVETIVDRKGMGPGPFGDPRNAAAAADSARGRSAGPAHAAREQLIALADGYFNTLQLNDGHIFTRVRSGLQPPRKRRVDRERSASRLRNRPESSAIRENFLRGGIQARQLSLGRPAARAALSAGGRRKGPGPRRRVHRSFRAARQVHHDRRRGPRSAAEIAAFVLLPRAFQDSWTAGSGTPRPCSSPCRTTCRRRGFSDG